MKSPLRNQRPAFLGAAIFAGLLTLALDVCSVAAQEKGAPKPKPAAKADAEPERGGAEARRPGNQAESTKTEMRPWLGVATSGVDPAVRQHLDLPDGFGITVEYVVEGSPAEKAGITPHDILVRLDDQRLISPEHLAVLVRSMAKGDRIKLVLIRKGAEQVVEVTLGENEVPVQPEWPRAFGMQIQPGPGHGGAFPIPMVPNAGGDWQKSMREYQEKVEEWIEKREPRHVVPHPDPHVRPGHTDPKGGADPKKEPALPLPDKKPAPSGGKAEADKTPDSVGSKPPAISVRPGFPIQVFGGAGLIRIDNNEGEVTIQVQDGKHTIVIVNADGETVYQGDYDPEKGADALPKEAREQLKKMKLDDLKMLGLPQGGAAGGKAEIEIKIETSQPKSSGPKAGPEKGKDGLL